jgi:MFS family permease
MPGRLGLVLPSPVPIILFALLFFVLLAFGGVVLLSLALRYRAGTARRKGRRWVATMNAWVTSFSAVLFLCFTFLISFWLGPTLRFALAGMAVGGLVGLLGLILTRWESQSEGFFYTPSRWLTLLIILAIGARLVYGWWHGLHHNVSGQQHWFLSASGTQLSVAVAAGLIGYYLVYAIGVSLRITRHEKQRSKITG